MTGEAIAFYVLAAITLASGIVVVTSPNLVHSAVALIPALLGVTGVYILLNAEFLAGIQVLIYAGGITVLILFVIMLTEGGTGLRVRQRNEQGPIAAAVAAAVAALFVALAGGRRGRGRFRRTRRARSGRVFSARTCCCSRGRRSCCS